MTSLSGEFQTDLSIDDAVVACTDALDGLGWRLETVEANRIVAFADTHPEDPPKVEVGLRESGSGTEFRIIGSDSEQNRLEQDELISVLDQARDAINGAMDRAEAEGRKEAEKPQPTEERKAPAAAPAAAATAERSRPERDDRVDEGNPDAAPGWYPDVYDESRERYWDGDEWTDEFRPAGGAKDGDEPGKPEKAGRKASRAERRERSRARAEERRRERERERGEANDQQRTEGTEKPAPASDDEPSTIPAKFRSLSLIANIYGALAWVVAVLGPIAVIAAAASASGGDVVATLIGGLLGVAFYALLLFGIAAAIRLALAVEKNTRDTAELIRERLGPGSRS